MNRPVNTTTLSRVALQSYLDGLLQEATEELEASQAQDSQAPLDEFQAAVLEEQARDARVSHAATRPQEPIQVRPPVSIAPQATVAPVALEAAVAEVMVPAAPIGRLAPVDLPPAPDTQTLAEEHAAPVLSLTPEPARAAVEGRPAWAAEPFECLLFDVAGLTLAVPLVCLGSIYPLVGQTLTPLFGQPEWFLGLLPSQSGNLKVLDTARWVMPDRYRDELQEGLQYVISVQGYEWGLAVHQVSRSLRLDPNQIKWRSQRGQRPWLAGTVIEHMCALLDVAALAELIDSGAVKHLHGSKPIGQTAGKSNK